ncbi:dienelactone hydrolase family protein [Falsiroseomonas bella]|uniref:dienelactone hydrolase family protein n=1 Tax=Falsiroseomonas bella TaxID=2184016 RepID=UPI001304BABB|nr:dienelactone hydrolase family protein [Falsiroseomonas bella]
MLVLVLAAAAQSAEPREPPRRPIHQDEGDAIGLISRPAAPMRAGLPRRPPAVLVVHDALGIDGRAESYVRQLLGAGFLVLEIELAPLSLDGAASPMPDDAEAASRVSRALVALAAEADPSRLGAMGFGAGARAVALMPGAPAARPVAARVLLYPGCAALRRAMTSTRSASQLSASPALLLHGREDPANPEAACAALAATLEEAAPVRRIGYGGAGYAWDLPAVGGLERTRLEAPDGGGTVMVMHWPALTELAAAQVAAFFCRTVGGCR